MPGASAADLKQRSLTNLYNLRPTWLALAHTKLDEAVLEAYGWPHELERANVAKRSLGLPMPR